MNSSRTNTQTNPVFSRVICCQGTIQLAVAIHVLLYRQSKVFAGEQPVFNNYLIVHDLFTQKNQELAFFEVIKKMAEGVLRWDKIIYVDSSTMTQFEEIYNAHGKAAFDQSVEEKLGIAGASEVYISRNWQKGSIVLLNIFAQATKICYGDSIGLYFPESYFSDKDWWTRFRLSYVGLRANHFRNKIRNIVKHPKRRPLLKVLSLPDFDYGYFCFPSISGNAPTFKFETIPVDGLKVTFEKFTNHISLEPALDIDFTKNFSVLLTSNFSEAERMSCEDEVTAYIKFLQAHRPENSVLLVKPHPRDSKEKIELLKQRLIKESFTVFVLDNALHFYIPFEFFLINIEQTNPGTIQKIKFFTVSSACLSFWFLFRAKPYIGLGDDLVKQFFRADQVRGRLAHEKDLRTLIESSF